MKKVLIHFVLLTFLGLSGCASERFSLIHHIDIQQGNAVTQDMVDGLKPGMTKRQVQLIMGTPMIVDVFRQDRWDYPYLLKADDEPNEARNVSLYFENDQLVRITGDLVPSNTQAKEPVQERVSVTVPYQDRQRRGVLTRLWRFLTFRNRGEK